MKKAVAQMREESAFEKTATTRALSLMLNTGHLQEHDGNLVTYFRVKGMVPPSSQGQ